MKGHEVMFGDITNLQTTTDKNYFREKISIFIKIVEAVCKRFELAYSQADSADVSSFIRFGILDSENQIQFLLTLLKKDLLNRLYKSLATVEENAELFEPFLIQFDVEKRSKLQKEQEESNLPTIVDLFCGAGGLSLGFKQVGFKTLFANDMDSLCIETYKYNHPEIPEKNIVCGDIREICNEIDTYISEDVDVVIGGPPCQGFSSANKHHRVIDDPRNELYKYFLKAVELIAPKFVVMENVKGMLKVADQVVEDYEQLRVQKNGKMYSYRVSYELLNSADFSVAQSRERLIYLAIRNDVSDRLHIEPSNLFEYIHRSNRGNTIHTLEEALEGLRPLLAPHKMNVGEIDTEEGGRKIDSNPYIGNENSYLNLINQGREIPLVFNHKARYCSELNHEIYKRMNQGDDATDPKIADIMPYAHRNNKFKDKYYRLYADRPCRTITAHLRSDCHSHIHPYQNRGLTPREAARVQSFPDDYCFLGPYLKTYIQIGNAVPTLMARGIASAIKHYLEVD